MHGDEPLPDPESPFDEAAREAVDLGNRLMDANPEADPWEVASGLLSGAVHFWLHSRQPCGDPGCESCMSVSDAQSRLMALLDECKAEAESSFYYHAPTDSNAGHA